MAPRGRKSSKEPVNTKIKLKQFAAEKHFDESLTEAPIEEHLILRLPPSLAKALRPAVAKRDIPADLQLSWKDARHGKLTYASKTFNSTLVDLPCISESLKTLDNKQFYKIADISQMIIVHDKKGIPPSKDFSWPDGLSPVLQNVRNTRFRKRMNKKIVEDVEEEIERLLLADFEVEDVTWEVLERKENESEDENDEEDDEDGAEGEDGDDFDLAAAIEEALDKPDDEDQEDDDEDSEEDEESGEESDQELEEDPDEKNEENELKIQANALRHEITALENKLAEKEKLASNQVNAIMKERFKGIVEKLAKELELKNEQLETLLEEIADEEEM